MTKKRPPAGFPKGLSEPIISDIQAQVDADADIRLEIGRITKLRREKLESLLDYFEIGRDEKSRWLALSWRLALQFVPGFDISPIPPRKRGRPSVWVGSDEFLLVAYVEVICENEKCTPRTALRKMIKDRPDKWGRFKGKLLSLEARYYEAKRRQEPSPALAAVLKVKNRNEK